MQQGGADPPVNPIFTNPWPASPGPPGTKAKGPTLTNGGRAPGGSQKRRQSMIGEWKPFKPI
eukprot:7431083-Prorocentrum_lima.AAC.1